MHAIPLELHHYVQNGDAFEHVLGNLGLAHYFDNLPLDTKVVDLLERPCVPSSFSVAGYSRTTLRNPCSVATSVSPSTSTLHEQREHQ